MVGRRAGPGFSQSLADGKKRLDGKEERAYKEKLLKSVTETAFLSLLNFLETNDTIPE